MPSYKHVGIRRILMIIFRLQKNMMVIFRSLQKSKLRERLLNEMFPHSDAVQRQQKEYQNEAIFNELFIGEAHLSKYNIIHAQVQYTTRICKNNYRNAVLLIQPFLFLYNHFISRIRRLIISLNQNILGIDFISDNLIM